MTTNGTTGDHPREDSPQSDGPGIRDSGITTVGYSSTPAHTGTDSKEESGSDMANKSQLSQRFQLAQKSADLSTCSRSGVSQPPSDPRDFQDAESDQAKNPHTTCGRTEKIADSSEESLFTKLTRPVRQVNLISGLESSDASLDQRSQRQDLTIRLANNSDTPQPRKKSFSEV